MKPPLDGTILLTGASSGIGREMAKLLAPAAKKLILVARRVDRLHQLRDEIARPGLEVDVRACDLNDLAAVERLVGEVGDVDVLINNAGFGDVSLFEFTNWEKTESMIRVSITALTLLTHRVVPGMIRRGRGGILNISSGWGLTWIPGVGVYSATKHYVSALTEVLRLELKSLGIVVSQVCPGPVKTEFIEVSGNPTGHDIPGFIAIDAEHCARAAVRGFAKGRAIIIPGLTAKFLILLGRVSPRWLLRLAYGWIGGWLRKRQRPQA